jgi:uncharacterized Zn-binding protein involved in type VI secretion
MSALEAARLGDQIGHTSAMKGLLAGLVAGFVITGLVLLAAGATVATGGAAAVVIGALIAGTAGGGLAGMKIGALFGSGGMGPIVTGSPNTFLGTGAKPAARATLDTVLCATHKVSLIAQGSTDVFINRAPAARHTDATVCSAKIREGQFDVFFGGPTGTYLEMESEVPGWLVTVLEVGVWVGAAIATGGAILTVGLGAALGGLAGGLIGSYAGGKIGAAIGGIFGARGAAIGEAVGGFLGGMAGGALGAKGGGALEGAFKGTTDVAPAVRPDTSSVKYGPDSAYQKADGTWDWPSNGGFDGTPTPETLPVGTRIDRFGGDGGKYLSPEGTPFEQRALAPSSLDDPYTVYQVAKPLPVQSGKIAPAFDQPGGGVQYKTGSSVADLVSKGYLVPVGTPIPPP